VPVGHRTCATNNADLYEAAAIWRARADECFEKGLIDDYDHAIKCAERFEEQMKTERTRPGNRWIRPRKYLAA
jgi:hypothetical protein